MDTLLRLEAFAFGRVLGDSVAQASDFVLGHFSLSQSECMFNRLVLVENIQIYRAQRCKQQKGVRADLLLLREIV